VGSYLALYCNYWQLSIVNKPPEDERILTPVHYWRQPAKLADIYIRLAAMLSNVAQCH